MKKKFVSLLLCSVLVFSTLTFATADDLTVSTGYGKDGIAQTVDGNVTVTSNGVTLKNLTITGDLIIAPEEGTGTNSIYLNNVTVEGALKISGAAKSIYLSGSVAKAVISSNVALRLTAGTIDELAVEASAEGARIYIEKGAGVKNADVVPIARLHGRGTIETAKLGTVLIKADSGLIKAFAKGSTRATVTSSSTMGKASGWIGNSQTANLPTTAKLTAPTPAPAAPAVTPRYKDTAGQPSQALPAGQFRITGFTLDSDPLTGVKVNGETWTAAKIFNHDEEYDITYTDSGKNYIIQITADKIADQNKKLDITPADAKEYFEIASFTFMDNQATAIEITPAAGTLKIAGDTVVNGIITTITTPVALEADFVFIEDKVYTITFDGSTHTGYSASYTANPADKTGKTIEGLAEDA